MSGILEYIVANVGHLHSEYIRFKEQSKEKKAADSFQYERTVVATGKFELNFA